MNLKTITRRLLQGTLALALLAGVYGTSHAKEASVFKPADGSYLTPATDPAYPTPAPPMNNDIDDHNSWTKFSRQSTIPDRVTKRTERDNEMIEQVEQRLEPYGNIDVDAEEGVVRLRGNVDTIQERDAIISNTRSVGGVQSVESYIRVNNQ